MKSNWKRNIVLYLAGQTVSLFGTALVQYAIMWHITLTTQSGLMMTVSILCGFLPTFLLSPFAGVWADRFNRRLLIVAADAGIAAFTLALAVLFWLGYDDIWLLFLISAIRAIGSALQTPAVGAILPQMVPEDQLTRINGINGSIQALITLVAPMVSAALLTFAELEWIFLIDVATAAVAIAIMLFFSRIPVHAKAAQKQQAGYFADIAGGFVYIRQQRFLFRFFLFCALFFIWAAPATFLTPLQVVRRFGEDVWRLTAIEVVFSIGMMLGGVIIAAWGGFRNRIHTMALGCFMFGVFTVALGVIPNFWIYLVAMGLVGVSVPVFNTPSTVLLQEKVQEDYLGRVFGILSMLTGSMMPIGMLLFGPAADYVRIEWMLIGTGVIMTLLTAFLMGSKSLIQAGVKTEAVPAPSADDPA
jgi:DHA3 family macrolide efflux protein-like MFS transporter